MPARGGMPGIARAAPVALRRHSAGELRTVIEGVPAAIAFLDDQARYVYVNAQYEAFFGLRRGAVLGRPIAEVFGLERASPILEAHARVMSGQNAGYERRHVFPDGRIGYLEVSVVPRHSPNGEVCGVFYLVRDSSERKVAEQALQESEARFRALTELSSDWYWEQDAAYRFTLVRGKFFTEVLGVAEAYAIGKCRWELEARNMAETDWARHRALLDARQPFRGLVIERTDKHGRVRYLENAGVPIFAADGGFLGYRGVGHDITERVEAEQRIRQLAHFDAITQLPNRATIEDRIVQALAQAHREGRSVAVMMLDLDRFKTINDSLGHPVGDALLAAVATRLCGVIRESDSIGRIGGDEFAVCLPQIDGASQAAVVAGKLLASLQAPFGALEHELEVTASIGIAVYPQDGDNLASLMRAADTAMYHAKSAGRGVYRFFAPAMNAAVTRRLALESGLRRSLDRGGFEIHYQPRVELRTGKVLSLEALARWRLPNGELSSPLEFVPVCEDAGLIHRLGEWVLRQACAQLLAWRASGYPVGVAVNVSPRQLLRPEFVALVKQTVTDLGVEPRLLELEITESVMIDNTEESLAALEDLRVFGVRVSLDDFGTGYSSLSYLRRFPFDMLKIDQSFVRDLSVSGNTDVLAAILALAKCLGLETVAEGIETEDQFVRLSALGCHSGQGYLFTEPRPAAALEGWLAERHLATQVNSRH